MSKTTEKKKTDDSCCRCGVTDRDADPRAQERESRKFRVQLARVRDKARLSIEADKRLWDAIRKRNNL